jgi:hypothetical protein
MTERTITQEKLKAVLEEIGHTIPRVNRIIEEAFPPIFKPKEGEIVLAGNDKGLPIALIVEFSHMHNKNYVCYHGITLRTFLYAKPQTPTQKGE